MSVVVATNGQGELKAPLFVDAFLLVIPILLIGFGIVMLYSTTGVVSQEKFGDSLFFVKRQGFATFIGALLMIVLSRFKLEWFQKISPMCLFAAIALLCLPIIPGLGDSSGGASRWVNLFGFRFQPGEFVKLLFILFMAGYFTRHQAKLHSFSKGVLQPGIYVALIAFLYLLEPDFGSSVIAAAVVFAMACAAGARLRHILVLGLVGGLCFLTLILISPYRMTRVLSFLSPYQDASGSGYQLIQSLIAVGSGQLTGVGLGASQQKLFFLPAAHTDFIFAVVGEELGFIGCMLLLAVFLVFLWRGLLLAAKLAEDCFAYVLTVGLTLLIVVPALLNIGVVIGLLPTKGMVLPLVGYGGSSLISCMMTVGIILALARHFRDRI